MRKWEIFVIIALLGAIVVLDREVAGLRAVWNDTQQRLERLEDHLEQLEWYLLEDEEQAYEDDKA